MAQIANVTDPGTISVVEVVQPLPIGSLIDVGDVVSIDAFSSTFSLRFPVPPSAVAFLTGVDAMLDEPIKFDELIDPYVIVGAVEPQAIYLELTIGQIWPRTG